MLNTITQLKKLIDTSERPLVIFAASKNDDFVAGALALKKYLSDRGKHTELVSSNFILPSHLSFIGGVKEIKPELSHLHKFTIKVDVSKTKIETLSYDIKDDWLSIHLTPKQGVIAKNNLRTLQTSFKYDLIFCLGAVDFEALGDIFFNNTDLFYRTPIVNIDNQPGNEHFGTINLVDLTATSVSEIVYKTFDQIGSATNSESATIILTGMIARTRSFKTPNVTPQTLSLAGKLINLGAEREKIIQNLYRTKTIPTLKLWGRALSNVQLDSSSGLAWSSITRDDFIRSGASESDLSDLIHELMASSPDTRIILLMFEDLKEPNKIHGHLTVDKNYDALQISKSFGSRGNKLNAEFSIFGQSLKEAEDMAVNEIRKQIISCGQNLN